MPADPPTIYTVPSASPGVPGTLHTVPSASPGSPGAVHVVPGVGGGSADELTVTGTLSPDATGTLTRVVTPWSLNFPGGSQWSSNGNAAAPGAGAWKDVYQGYLVTPATTTLNALAPKGGYVATGLQSTASRVLVATADFASSALYWLYDDAGTARWVLAGDGGLTLRDAVSIPSGRIVFPDSSPGVGFVGGLGATWQAATDAIWLWVMRYFSGATQTGTWSVQGLRPTTTGWAVVPGFGSGTPLVAGLGEVVAPPSVFSGAPTLTPNTPPVITA